MAPREATPGPRPLVTHRTTRNRGCAGCIVCLIPGRATPFAPGVDSCTTIPDRWMRHLFRLLGVVCAAAPLAAQTRRPVTSDDYFNLKVAGDPALSPDGKLVAYTVTRVDRALNRRVSAIWLVPADGSAPPRQLTAGSMSSSAPLWRPDGKAIAFSSVRPLPGDSASLRSQEYLHGLSGGEPV